MSGVSFAELQRRDRSNAAGKSSGFKGVEGSQPSPSMSTNQKVAAGAALAGAITGGSSGGTSSTGGALKGAASGAMAGAAFGAPGAIIGGVLGGVTGIMGAKSAKKKQAAQAQAEKHQALAGIAQEKGQRINQALSSMAQAFGSTLKQNKFLGRL